MFVCTNCGWKKTTLTENPEFRLNRDFGERCVRSITGTMDLCSQCNQQTFFFITSEPEKPGGICGGPIWPEEPSSSDTDAVEPKRTYVQKLHANNTNWAIRAMDPPAGCNPFLPPPRHVVHKYPRRAKSPYKKEPQEYKLRHFNGDAMPENSQQAQSEQGKSRNAALNAIYQRRAASVVQQKALKVLPLHLSPEQDLRKYNQQPSQTLIRSVTMNQSKPLHKLVESDYININEEPSSSRHSIVEKKTVRINELQAGNRGLADMEQRALDRNVLNADVQHTISRSTVDDTSRDTPSEIDNNELPTTSRRNQYALDTPRLSRSEIALRSKTQTEFLKNWAKDPVELYAAQKLNRHSVASVPDIPKRKKPRTGAEEEKRKLGGSFDQRNVLKSLQAIGSMEDQLMKKERQLNDLRHLKQQIKEDYNRAKAEVRKLQCQKVLKLQRKRQEWDAIGTMRRQRSRSKHILSPY